MLQRRFAGLTYAAIAAEAGLSRQRIQQVLRPPKAIRDVVIDKADGKCADCGIEVGASGDVHHKGSQDGESYNEISNLVLLCVPCHMRQHAGRKTSRGKLPKTKPTIVRRIMGYELLCNVCHRTWRSWDREPLRCGKCKSPAWFRERKKP